MTDTILFFVTWVPFMTACFLFSLWMYRQPLKGIRVFLRLIPEQASKQLLDQVSRVGDTSQTNVAIRSVWSAFTLGPALFLGLRLSLADQARAVEYMLTHETEDKELTDAGAIAWQKYRRVLRRMAVLMMAVSGAMLATIPIGALVALI